MAQDPSITEAASKILEVLIRRRAVAGQAVRVEELVADTGLSFSDFDSADTYLLQARYIEGTGGGRNGSRWLTPYGIEWASAATRMPTKEEPVMPTLKERVENNLAVFFLGAITLGFVSGLATYEGALRISDRTTIAADRLRNLEDDLSKGKAKLAQLEQELIARDEIIKSDRGQLATTKKELQEIRDGSVPRTEHEQLKQNLFLAKSGEKSQLEIMTKIKDLTKHNDALLLENQRLMKQIHADIVGQITKLEEQQKNLEQEIHANMAELEQLKSAASGKLQECEICKEDPKCPSNFKLGSCALGANLEAKAGIMSQKIEWNKGRLNLVTSQIVKLHSNLGVPSR